MREGSFRDIKHGMHVQTPSGDGTARVDEVLYDEGSDIFVGLSVREGNILHEKKLLVPGEHVTAVHEGHVEIDVEIDSLQPYLSPAEKMAQAQEQYAAPGPVDDIVI